MNAVPSPEKPPKRSKGNSKERRPRNRRHKSRKTTSRGRESRSDRSDREWSRGRESDKERRRERKRRRRDERDRDRDGTDRRHRGRRDERQRNTRRRTAKTPEWLKMLEMEWFQAMEMLTSFHHRDNYRDQFLRSYEKAVFERFPHFWHNQNPETNEVKELEALFESTYFDFFQSIRQIREFRMQMIADHETQQTMAAINAVNAAAPPPKMPMPHDVMQQQLPPTTNQQQLISMLGIGDDVNQNIQKLKAALLASQGTDNPNATKKTLRAPRMLQVNHFTISDAPSASVSSLPSSALSAPQCIPASFVIQNATQPPNPMTVTTAPVAPPPTVAPHPVPVPIPSAPPGHPVPAAVPQSLYPPPGAPRGPPPHQTGGRPAPQIIVHGQPQPHRLPYGQHPQHGQVPGHPPSHVPGPVPPTNAHGHPAVLQPQPPGPPSNLPMRMPSPNTTEATHTTPMQNGSTMPALSPATVALQSQVPHQPTVQEELPTPSPLTFDNPSPPMPSPVLPPQEVAPSIPNGTTNTAIATAVSTNNPNTPPTDTTTGTIPNGKSHLNVESISPTVPLPDTPEVNPSSAEETDKLIDEESEQKTQSVPISKISEISEIAEKSEKSAMEVDHDDVHNDDMTEIVTEHKSQKEEITEIVNEHEETENIENLAKSMAMDVDTTNPLDSEIDTVMNIVMDTPMDNTIDKALDTPKDKTKDVTADIPENKEMDEAERERIEDAQDREHTTDEQICEVLKIPPPPRDPRLSRETTPNTKEDKVPRDPRIKRKENDTMEPKETMECREAMDLDLNGAGFEDENVSVISDVVTEDDIVMPSMPSSPNSMGIGNDEEVDNDSTHSMSPEVAIEAQQIRSSHHAEGPSGADDDDTDFDIGNTLDVLGDIDFLNNVPGDDIDDIHESHETKAVEVEMDNVMEENEGNDAGSEMKTNSTNMVTTKVDDPKEDVIGIDTSWLSSDDDLDKSLVHLPGMSAVNTMNNDTLKAVEEVDPLAIPSPLPLPSQSDTDDSTLPGLTVPVRVPAQRPQQHLVQNGQIDQNPNGATGQYGQQVRGPGPGPAPGPGPGRGPVDQHNVHNMHNVHTSHPMSHGHPPPPPPQHGYPTPSHYIPPPSYYNPPAPGQDIDRRKMRRPQPTSSGPMGGMNMNPELQPRRRAVRRRPKPNMNNNINMVCHQSLSC